MSNRPGTPSTNADDSVPIDELYGYDALYVVGTGEPHGESEKST